MHLSEKPLFAAWHQRDGLEEADSIWHCLPPIAKSMTTRKPQPRRTRSLPLSNGHISSLSLPFSQLYEYCTLLFAGGGFLEDIFFERSLFSFPDVPSKEAKIGSHFGVQLHMCGPVEPLWSVHFFFCFSLFAHLLAQCPPIGILACTRDPQIFSNGIKWPGMQLEGRWQ